MTNSIQEIKALKIPGEAKIILEGFANIEFGKISILTPEKMLLMYEGSKSGPQVHLELHDWKVFTEVLSKSDIGLAETYIKKIWDADSISSLIELAILNEKKLEKAFMGNIAKIIYYRIKHDARENSIFGSKQNIKAHYDLGNNFYQLWLDKTMTYSSAMYHNDYSISFEMAQNNKYQSMLDLISPKPNDHILEVGCGWGGFLEFAGQKGYRVTGITISDEQFLFAKERIKNLKLEHLVDVVLCDYRQLDGKFDHAVSIEMIEAVGEKYWDSYFALFKRVLNPNGRFAVQAIVMNDQNFNHYKKGTDFIQQYIFPGGMLLSPNTIKELIENHKYTMLQSLSFGLNYAHTLNLWYEKFNLEKENIEKLSITFNEEFIRLWNFYLKYCEGAFRANRIDVVQFSATISAT